MTPRSFPASACLASALASALALVALASASLAGCSRFAEYGTVVEANRLHERGLYQDAVAGYLSVRSGSFRATVDYDLANVYARLGELPAASELYARAREAGLPSLVADAFFNEGVLLFEKGKYEEAWRAFRSAIAQAGREGSASFLAAARRNLELAWKAWMKRTQATPETAAPTGIGGATQDEAELRLLERLETGRWRPGGADEAPAAKDDY